MGKGQRNKVTGNTTKGMSGKAAKPSVGIKAILITVAVIAVFLLLVGLTIYNYSQSQGWFEGNDVVMNTENFSVNEGMFAYYFKENYMSIYNSYYSLLGSNISSYIDTSKSLKEQSYLGGSQTWYEVILDQTKNSVSEYLSLCEKAREVGITIGAEEKEEINSVISSLAESAKTAKYPSTGDYIRALFGKGVSESKIRKALEIEELAEKYVKSVTDAVDVSEEALEAVYNEDAISYDEVSYLTYAFKADDLLPKSDSEDEDAEKTEPTEEEIAAAKETIAKSAEELSAITTEEEFAEYVLNYEKDKKNSSDDDAKKAADGVLSTGVKYSETDEAKAWAFEAKAGESKVVTSEDGKTATVYVLVGERARNDNDGYRNVRHVLFSSKTDENKEKADGNEYGYDDPAAKSKEVYDEWVAGGASEDQLKILASKYSTDSTKDNGGLIEDVYEGHFVEPFNTWLFEDGRKAGDYTLLETQYGWHIAYVVDIEEPQWQRTIKNNLTSDAYTEASKAAAEEYPVTVAEGIGVDA